ncbi:MAG: haloacid dehalogenase, partial [Candidatus Methanomethylophilaceae archaeon]|nr:haloacid dehalogenase [Candidatus Methanomethylophilaceae archaeon]
LDPFSDEDDERFGIRNGYDLKTCDNLAAYMEAFISIRYGVSSTTLRDGVTDTRQRLSQRTKGIDASGIMAELDAMHI